MILLLDHCKIQMKKNRRTTLSERSAEKYWSIVSVYRTLTAVFRGEIRNSVTCFGGLLVCWLLVTIRRAVLGRIRTERSGTVTIVTALI